MIVKSAYGKVDTDKSPVYVGGPVGPTTKTT